MLPLFDHWRYEIKKRRIRDQRGLWINSFFRNISYSLINIMSVLFVFQMGREHFLSGGIVNGIAFVLVYRIMIRSATLTTAIPIADKVIRRIGYRKSILWSLVGSCLVFLSFAIVSSTGWWFLIPFIGILVGIIINLYFITFLTLYTDDSNSRHMGSSVGILTAVSRLGQVVAPFIGAMITVTFGYEALFAFAMIFLVLAAVPMFFLKHHLHFDQVSWKEFFQWGKDEDYARMSLALGGEVIDNDFYMFLWPLFVFLTVGSIESVGLFGSATLLATAIFSFFIAKLFDRPNNRFYQLIGVAGSMLMWGARLFVRDLGSIIAVDVADKPFTSTAKVFFASRMLKRARGKESFSFFAYREVMISGWIVLAYTTLLVVLLTLGLSVFWPVMVVMGATGMAMTLLLEDRVKKKRVK